MYLRYFKSKSTNPLLPVVYIPGFASSTNALREIAELLTAYTDVYAVELPGYGTGDANTFSYSDTASFFEELHSQIQSTISVKYVLGGYSMGARIALHYALQYPEAIAGLLLESGSSGIEDATERVQRKDADDALSAYILSHTAEEFASYWVNLPIFKSLDAISPEKRAMNFAEKLQCTPEALRQSLRLFGQGIMEPVGERLGELAMPVLLMYGEKDEKYAAINKRMAKNIHKVQLHGIPGAGHNIHLEKTSEFINLVLSFLQQLKEQR